MKKHLLTGSILLALLMPGSAMAIDQNQVDPGIKDGTAVREFKQARAKWLKHGVRNYRMTVRRFCYCAGPFKATIKVRKRKPVQVSAPGFYGPKTVPGMFRIIWQAINSKVAKLDVKYQGRYGFPKRTSIDYIAMAIDDEISYRINGFTELHPNRADGPTAN